MHSDNAHILLKYPTRQRPAKFMENLNAYLNKLSGKHQITLVVSMDADDPLCNNPGFRTFLDRKKSDLVNVIYAYGESKGKINAINRDIPNTPWDILVATADDMEPMIDGWDAVIAEDMLREFPNFDGSINYNTDPRLETKIDGRPEGWKGLITLPVIGRKLYDRFGYIYHPDYISESCDDEQTLVYTQLGVLRHVDKRPIFHNFKPWHDELMIRNMQIGQTVDRKKFLERKEKNFDLEVAV
jgi:hypothetical protein